MGRRGLLKGTLVGGLGAAGLAGAPTAEAEARRFRATVQPRRFAATVQPTRTASGFTHPGLLHTQADFDRMARKVAAGRAPWIDGWNRLVANGHSSAGWQPRPLETVIRGGTGQNYPQLYRDIHAAYQNALRWKVTGQEEHAATAVRILNAWSKTLREITGNADRFLAAGIYGYQIANAAEIVREVDGFKLNRFKQMLADVFYPLNDRFLTDHNDACITNYWANWDLCTMASLMAIGIFNEDRSKFDRAVDYFHNGEGNGALTRAVPFIYDGEGLAQWQESGRDQAHSLMGIGLMATICEMAWNQGVDLYDADDNRFAKAAEYVARYNNGSDVPFTTYSWGTGQNCAYREQTFISADGRGQARPVWEMVYHHYLARRSIAMPNVAAIVGVPEGGGGDYGPNSGGFDALGFGTLTHVRLRGNDIPDDLAPLGSVI